MSTLNLDNGKACFFEIKEYTKGERAAVMNDGNIARWSYTNDDKQKFLLIPLGNDKVNIVSLHDGRFWTVSEYAANASVELQPALRDNNGEKNPDNPRQRFQLVPNHSSGKKSDVFNIVEFTENELVAVSTGWFDNGNFIRWGGSPNDEEKLFSFRQMCVPIPANPLTNMHQAFPESPRLEGFRPPAKNRTEPVIVDSEIWPFYLIDNHFDVNNRHLQFRSVPYYIMRQEVYWQAASEPYLEHDGVSVETERTIEITKGVTERQVEEIKKYFKTTTTVGVGLKLVAKIMSLMGEAGGNIKVSEESGEETKTLREVKEISDRKVSLKVHLKPGVRVAYAHWQRIDRFTLLDPKNLDRPIFSWEIPSNKIDVRVIRQQLSTATSTSSDEILSTTPSHFPKTDYFLPMQQQDKLLENLHVIQEAGWVNES